MSRAAPNLRPATSAPPAAVAVLIAISFSHMLNDFLQSLMPALYPMLKSAYHANFAQIGLLTLTYQLTASVLQPFIGHFTDRSPQPYSLAAGMGVTFSGLLLLAFAGRYGMLLCAAALIGTGSAIFHPESSRIARMASGGRHGLAQSLFQVGGNLGGTLGPLLAALIVVRHGQASIAWFSAVALAAMALLVYVGHWYRVHGLPGSRLKAAAHPTTARPRAEVVRALLVLLALMFSKYFYLASLGSYYTFYLMSRFHVSVQSAQLHLFVFLAAATLGTLLGGPLTDRIGRKYIIWASILGVLPFTLLLPHASLFWTGILTVPIGVIISSAFPAIVVYAQELLPGRTGAVSGLFFGLAFGVGGIGAGVLGWLADVTSVELVYEICAFLPALGLLAGLLPDTERYDARMSKAA